MSTRRFCAGHRTAATVSSRQIAVFIVGYFGTSANLARPRPRRSASPSIAAETSRLHRRSHRKICFALGIDDQKTILALAGAGCFNAGQVSKGHVEQTALAAVGGRKGIGHSGLPDLVRGNFGGHAKFLRAQSLEVSSIEADEIVLA